MRVVRHIVSDSELPIPPGAGFPGLGTNKADTTPRTNVSCWLIDAEYFAGMTGYSYVVTSPNAAGCPDNTGLVSVEECTAALDVLGFKSVGGAWSGEKDDIP